jgi:hypothetical protein
LAVDPLCTQICWAPTQYRHNTPANPGHTTIRAAGRTCCSHHSVRSHHPRRRRNHQGLNHQISESGTTLAAHFEKPSLARLQAHLSLARKPSWSASAATTRRSVVPPARPESPIYDRGWTGLPLQGRCVCCRRGGPATDAFQRNGARVRWALRR